MKYSINLLLIMVVILSACDIEPAPTPEIQGVDAQTAARQLADYAIIPDILEVTVNEQVPALTIRFDMIGNNINVAHMNMGDLLCTLRDSGRFDGYLMQFRAKGHFQDNVGNPVDADGIQARITADTIARVNCENDGIGIIWETAAETYNLHPVLQESD